MLADMLPVTEREWFDPMARVSLLPTLSVALFPAETDASLDAFMNISSWPALSSIRISLLDPPPGVVAVWIDMRVLCSGSAYGGGILPLYRRPKTKGRSGSPSVKLRYTSQPTRGVSMLPPSGSWQVRIQRLDVSSGLPSRSQGKITFTRPCSSGWISWPAGPVVTAIWAPGAATARGTRGGR